MATTKTSSRKTTKKVARKPAKAPPESITKPAPSKAPAPPIVRRKELVARVVAATGMRPNQVKPVLNEVLAELGKALSAGEGINVPPLGKITVNRHKALEGREVLICKLRRKTENEKAALEPDAEER